MQFMTEISVYYRSVSISKVRQTRKVKLMSYFNPTRLCCQNIVSRFDRDQIAECEQNFTDKLHCWKIVPVWKPINENGLLVCLSLVGNIYKYLIAILLFFCDVRTWSLLITLNEISNDFIKSDRQNLLVFRLNLVFYFSLEQKLFLHMC